MQSYGAFYRSALDPLLKRINSYLERYLRRKIQAAAVLPQSAGVLVSDNQPPAGTVRPLRVGVCALADPGVYLLRLDGPADAVQTAAWMAAAKSAGRIIRFWTRA